MSAELIRAKRAALEHAIGKVVSLFEKETEMVVTRIDLERVPRLADVRPELGCVSVTCEL